MKQLAALTAVALLLCGCETGDEPNAPAGGSAGGTVKFLAFGDPGTGSDRQIAVGEAMAQVCAARGCDFALELGDNFYASGVTSITDPQWQTKFEIPYASLQVPVWATLGNHDNSRGPGEGSDNARGEHQVDYHYAAGRASEKWRMPARYYSFTAPAGAAQPLAQFWSLDSSPLTSILIDPSPAWNFLTYGAAQQEWLIGEMQASTAPWKIAFAHHPYRSNGLHGNAGNFDGIPEIVPGTANGMPWKNFVEATLCANEADILFQGHDHELEWHQPQAPCGNTHFILSGAAEGPRPFRDANRNPTYWQVDNQLGFFWFELTPTQMRGAAFTLTPDNVLPLDGRGAPMPAFEQTLDKPYP